jgi:hypothetical protein
VNQTRDATVQPTLDGKGVKVCLESETIDSVIPRIFPILSIGTVYGSDAALYAFSSISQQLNLRSD